MREYLISKYVFGAGFVITLADVIKLSTGVVGLVGALLMMGAGWYSFQLKRMEYQDKKGSRK